MECNGVSFRNIEFGDAVYHLKSSRKLELMVKKRAGLELFPSESSGYDSSASSSVGDMSPRSDDSVTDLNHNKVKISVSAPDPPAVHPTPQNTRNHEDVKRKMETEMEEERRKLQSEQERLKREADALSEERRKLEEEKKIFRSTMGKSSLHTMPVPVNSIQKETPIPSHNLVGKTSSHMSDESNNSGSSSGSLATALQLEIKRRKQKAATSASSAPKPESVSNVSASPTSKKAPFITDKNEKHDMLIAEFKKAHKKMFTSSTESSEEEAVTNTKPVDPSKSPGVSEAVKVKCPPPPPVRTSSASSSGSSESLSHDRTATLLTVVNTPLASKVKRASNPGIPTPDYDSTPDRSPPTQRFTKHRQGLGHQSKHIPPPTVENIVRAKSLTALNNIDDQEEAGHKRVKAPAPTPLRAADSLADLRVTMTRPKEPPPSVSSPKSSVSNSRPTSSLAKTSSFQPEFFKRHPELDANSFERYETVGSSIKLKQSTYFDSRASPSLSMSSHYGQSEPRKFEFLPKPCDPTQLPLKKSGEEARIASQDYRGTINSHRILKVSAHTSINSNKSISGEIIKQNISPPRSDLKIKELSEKTARSFGLKKAPAPLPPILRK